MDEPSTHSQSQARRRVQHAESMLLQADFAEGAQREGMLTQAKDALIEAERMAPGVGAWMFACFHAYLGNLALCKKWLERAARYDQLPSKDHVANSPYFKRYRDSKWFRRIVNRAG
jgi:hypothetical protein